LDARSQANVGEAEFGFVVPFCDVKNDVRAVPLGLVFDEVNVTVHDVPGDFLTRHELSDLLGAAVTVLVMELELGTKFVGTAFDHLPEPQETC
jgi:hypothetical protein